MRRLINLKVLNVFVSALALVTLAVGAVPLATVSADGGTGTIALTVVNPPTGNPWVTVQWQNPASGGWYSIDSWTGPFDESAYGFIANGVDSANFGQGPFRWVLYDKKGGNVLGMSDPFYFPTGNGNWVWSSITLAAPVQ